MFEEGNGIRDLDEIEPGAIFGDDIARLGHLTTLTTPEDRFMEVVTLEELQNKERRNFRKPKKKK
jgi:hypothetical protein